MLQCTDSIGDKGDVVTVHLGKHHIIFRISQTQGGVAEKHEHLSIIIGILFGVEEDFAEGWIFTVSDFKNRNEP